MEAEKLRAGIQSVEVGFVLLEVLAAHRQPLMLRDLAAEADMSAAKAHRYLVSFQRLGLVTQDPATTHYELGPAALRLGLAALARIQPVQHVRRRLPELLASLRQTVALAVWGNHGPTVVHWEESPQAILVSLRLGDVMPLLSSATGRCFAAYMPRTALTAQLNDEMASARRHPVGDVPRTLKEVDALLDEVRRHRMGRVVGTVMPGVAGLCAPVFDANGHLVLGVVSLGSMANFDTAWNGPLVRELDAFARQMSTELGLQ